LHFVDKLLKLIRYIIFFFKFHSFIENRISVIYQLPITNLWFLPKISESYRLILLYR